MGVTFVRHNSDGLIDAFRVAEDVIVPEPEDSVALGLDQFISEQIDAVSVLSAIDFYDQLEAVTRKVGKVSSDSDLLAEMCLRESAPQQTPHCFFGNGPIAPKRPRAGS